MVLLPALLPVQRREPTCCVEEFVAEEKGLAVLAQPPPDHAGPGCCTSWPSSLLLIGKAVWRRWGEFHTESQSFLSHLAAMAVAGSVVLTWSLPVEQELG